ncbi:hypothetical protein HPB47_005349 [Ixodes persulcatus]|uniref:Uncharacterized protein n=1 Tax=Ixodes persulcatus TaxID=34615 RepID=A0AC60PDN1_IXOPE|nr:hypothetical protein HPB47_005349 [Ixodes persulcatus]
MGSRALLCTLGRRSEDAASYPQDGVCDFLFYDSYYTRGADTLIDDSSGRTQHFLTSAKASFSTQYGIAVAHGKEHYAVKDLSDQRGRRTMKKNWDMKVRHYGVLDVHTKKQAGTGHLESAFHLLRLPDDHRPLLTRMRRHPDGNLQHRSFPDARKIGSTPTQNQQRHERPTCGGRLIDARCAITAVKPATFTADAPTDNWGCAGSTRTTRAQGTPMIAQALLGAVQSKPLTQLGNPSAFLALAPGPLTFRPVCEIFPDDGDHGEFVCNSPSLERVAVKMISFQHLLIAITIIAAAINVEHFDQASDAVDVETLHYILQHEGLLRQTTIMTSFSMSVRWYHSANNLFDARTPSTNTNVTSANELCTLADDYSAYKTVEPQHFTQAYSDKNGNTATFDDTLTILWKLCSAFVEFRNATFGTAFFDVDYEDWQELCPQDEWKGYARLTAARDYFQHLKEPDSKRLNCSELDNAE